MQKIFKFQQNRPEYLAMKNEKREFSNKFQTAFWGKYEHIFYVNVFVISCRFHLCQNFELHYSDTWDFVQTVKNGFNRKLASETDRYRLITCYSSYILTTFRDTYEHIFYITVFVI